MSDDFDAAVNALDDAQRTVFDRFSEEEKCKLRTDIPASLLPLYLRLFSLNWASIETFSENLAAAVKALTEESASGRPNDPAQESSRVPWLWLIHQTKENTTTSATLAQQWYSHLARHDRERGSLSPNRALAAYLVATFELTRGNVAVGRRWYHIAHAEDARHSRNGAARTVLIETLRESPAELDELAKVVRDEKASLSDFRAQTEYLLTRWYLSRDLRQSDQSLDSEHKLDVWLLQQLVNALPLDRSTTKASGDALEVLAAYLLSHVVGCFPVRRSETLDFENDLVIRNLSRHVSPALDVLGRYFLVECKNWKHTVGTHEIAYFANRIRYGRLKFGVLFAREGISGDAEDGEFGENARFMIHRTYHQDGIVVAVVTATDLQRICDGKESTLSMLLRRHDEVRFGAWSRALGPRDRIRRDME